MITTAKLLADGLEPPEAGREDFSAQLFDSIEPPSGISIENEAEIQRRARQARDEVAGISWSEVKRSLVK